MTVRCLQGALHYVVEAAPVVEAAQIVVIGELLYVAGGVFFLGDVVEAADVVAEFAEFILDPAHHETHREQMPILVQATLLAHPELLLTDGPSDILFQVIAIIGRSKPDNMLSDHLIVAKPRDAAKGVIDLENDPLMIHDQQAVVGVEGHFCQAQGIVGGEPLQLDGSRSC